jgi:glycosyltransferase involved in cell wall biosynthesis
MQPKLSIIIPSHNNADQLSSLLDSIKSQRFTNFEVLVIDGNSTDSTQEVVEKYSPLVSYFVSENDKGIYDAMNKGIRASKGEWLYFIGCDDEFYSTDALLNVFQHEEEAINVFYGKIFNKMKQKAEGEVILSKKDLIDTSIWHQSVFYRRTVFEQFGEYDLSYKIAADVVFNLSTFSQSFNQWKFIDVVVSVFSGDGISSHTIDLKYHENQKRLFQQWFSGVDDHYIYSGLQHHLYHQIKLGNYATALGEYVTLFFKTKDRFTILKNSLYFLKQRCRSK